MAEWRNDVGLVCLVLAEALSGRFPEGLRQNHNNLHLALCIMADPSVAGGGDARSDARTWLLQLSRESLLRSCCSLCLDRAREGAWV